MAAPDRLVPVSTTPGSITGDSYMDQVQDEITGLWDRSTITLTSISGINTITATAVPALTGSFTGDMNFILKAAATNTAAVTLNINGTGATAVVDASGNALTAGALLINTNYLLHYDSGISKHIVIGYVPAAAVPIGLKLIARAEALVTPSSLDFFNGAAPSAPSGTITPTGTVVLDNTYDGYKLVISNLKPATDDVEAWLRIGTGATPTYQSANYGYAIAEHNMAGNTADLDSASASSIKMASTNAARAVGNAAAESFSASIEFNNPESTTEYCSFYLSASYINSGGNLTHIVGSGAYLVAGAITALRVQFESGNISSGSAALYGYTKS